MGRLLSSATCSPLLLAFWPSVGAKRRRYGERHGLGTRTGQGRKPRSGRAQARALTRSIPSPPASGGVNLAHQRPERSHATGADHRATTLYSVGLTTQTMMQSCASAAKLRSGGPILPPRHRSHESPRDSATSNRHRRTRHKRTDKAETIGCLHRPPFIVRDAERRLLARRPPAPAATGRSEACAPRPRSWFCECRGHSRCGLETTAPRRCPSGT